MDRYAVVGNPVAHSLSPRIHAAFAAATGQRLRYDRLLAPADGFVASVEEFFAAGGAGLNVTVPFKQQAADWVTELDAAAAAAGAVNTIVRAGAGFRGCNTDGAGLVRDLSVNWGVTLRGARVLLVGAGGAARGVVRPLLAQRPQRLVVVNRNAARAEQLVQSLVAEAALCGDASATISGGALAAATGPFDLVINGTSAGLRDAAPAVDPAVVAGACCYDMMYAPVPAPAGATTFCRWAAAHGASRVSDGLGMLVEQAALAFEMWRGIAPPTARILAQLRRGGV
ncbi:MAG: shikimate dehydrogenase [Pseudomonadales bacterium]